MEWYYVEAGQRSGPVTEEELGALVEAGRVRGDTLVWREGLENWRAHAEVRGSPSMEIERTGALASALDPAAAPQRVICSECKLTVDHDQAFEYGGLWCCASCKPLFLQKLKEGLIELAQIEFGGFWMRGLAKMLDFLVQVICLAVPMVALVLIFLGAGSLNDPAMFIWLNLIYQGLALAVGITYNTVFLGKWGATPGKMMCGLRVVQSDKNPISYPRAFGRAWAESLNMFTMGVGYVIAAFDAEKRALHDHVCDTRVIKSR